MIIDKDITIKLHSEVPDEVYCEMSDDELCNEIKCMFLDELPDTSTIDVIIN